MKHHDLPQAHVKSQNSEALGLKSGAQFKQTLSYLLPFPKSHRMKHLRTASYRSVGRNLITLTALISLLIPFMGCVSVKLGGSEVKKSSQVQFDPPSRSFASIILPHADSAWQNNKTGTTLSFISTCNDSSDPSLVSMRDSALRGLEELKLIKDEALTYNGREALRTEASGQLDGVKVEVRLMHFKKNFCDYTISMVGVQDKVKEDVSVFDNFLRGFKAP